MGPDLVPGEYDRARALAKTLRDRRVDMIYASDLLRTRMTAEAFQEILHVPMKFDRRLREADFGSYQGKRAVDLFEENPNHEDIRKYPFRKNPGGGESIFDMHVRLMDFLRDLKTRHTDEETILLVSHGGLARIFQAHFRKLPLTKVLSFEPIQNLQILEVEL